MRGRFVTTLLVAVLLTAALGVHLTAAASSNLFQNPAFDGAESQLPPPGWEIYREIDATRRISVIDLENPDLRALLIEDLAGVSGPDGEIGIMQTVPGGPGRYGAVVTFRGVENAPPGIVYFQIRFLPSNERKQIRLTDTQPWPVGYFETLSVEEVAPPGTTHVRVYLYTGQSNVGAIAVRSIELFRIDD